MLFHQESISAPHSIPMGTGTPWPLWIEKSIWLVPGQWTTQKWNRALNHESIKTQWIVSLRPSRNSFPFGIKIKVSIEVDLLHQLPPTNPVSGCQGRAENKQVRSKLRLSSTTDMWGFVCYPFYLIGTNIGEKMAGYNVHRLYVLRSVDLSPCSSMIYAIFFIGKQSNQLCE